MTAHEFRRLHRAGKHFSPIHVAISSLMAMWLVSAITSPQASIPLNNSCLELASIGHTTLWHLLERINEATEWTEYRLDLLWDIRTTKSVLAIIGRSSTGIVMRTSIESRPPTIAATYTTGISHPDSERLVQQSGGRGGINHPDCCTRFSKMAMWFGSIYFNCRGQTQDCASMLPVVVRPRLAPAPDARGCCPRG